MTTLEKGLSAVVVAGVLCVFGVLVAKAYPLTFGDRAVKAEVASPQKQVADPVVPQVFVCPVHGEIKQAVTVKQSGKPNEEYCFQCYVENIQKTCRRVSKKP